MRKIEQIVSICVILGTTNEYMWSTKIPLLMEINTLEKMMPEREAPLLPHQRCRALLTSRRARWNVQACSGA